MQLTFYGAAESVTGSCYLLEYGGWQILIDCGMFQGDKTLKERNYSDFRFEPGQIDLVLLTHAHIDHSGLLPKLYKKGYRGQILTTSGTRELCSVMLPDSGHIQEMEVERKNRKNLRSGQALLTPIYTAEEARQCLELFEGVEYETPVEPLPGIRVIFHDAGHILGSASIELELESAEGITRLAFSGDLGNDGQPIVRDPHRLEAADYLVMESTYGDRVRPKLNQQEKLNQLAEVISKTFRRGGNVVIPAFAVERTQDLLYYLNILLDREKIDPRQIYIDSPLAVAATEIFCRHQDYFDPETAALTEPDGACPLYLPGASFTTRTEDSIAINRIKQGALIISASGMCDAGRIKHHLKHNLWRPECTVILVGYQARGTLGRALLDGAQKVRIHGEEVAVRAEIYQLEGFSAHADQKGLLDWVKDMGRKPGKIFVTHGENGASETLAALLHKEFGVETIVPHWLEKIDLETGAVTDNELPASDRQTKLMAAFGQVREEMQNWYEARLAAGQYAEIQELLDELRRKLA